MIKKMSFGTADNNITFDVRYFYLINMKIILSLQINQLMKFISSEMQHTLKKIYKNLCLRHGYNERIRKPRFTTYTPFPCETSRMLSYIEQ